MKVAWINERDGSRMDKKPRISIITITFNSAKFVERAIKSVLNQRYTNLEYIIVDGGSTDGTVDIIKRYDDRITKWVSEPDKGISNAFNKGINMATGEIIGIINSDDGLLPGALANIAKAYNPSVDVYRGKVLLWKEDSDTKVVEIPTMHFSFGGLNNVSHQSTFIAKRAYEKYGMYDESCKYVMDYDLLVRFQNEGAKFKYIDKVLAFYTLGGVTFTKVTKARLDEIVRVMRQNGASNIDIAKYRVVKFGKETVKRIVPKETLLRIRHGKRDTHERTPNK